MVPVPRCLAMPLVLLLGACAQAPAPTAPAPAPAASAPVAPPPPPAPPPVARPFDEAIDAAAQALFSSVAGTAEGARRIVVIDPLIDGVTGEQTEATRRVQTRIARLAREQFPQFDVQPFTVETLRRAPLVLVGTFTGVDPQGRTQGLREAYRVCLALADLDSRTVVGKGTARARMEGVDATPLPYFRDSPAWAIDAVTEGYVKTCQGTRVGDPMDAFYVARIVSAASVHQAVEAYNAGRFRDALGHYSTAMQAAAGDELRILNGVYLTNWRLGKRDAARMVFGRIVDFGLDRKRMAVRFLFKPGSTAFVSDPKLPADYPYWIGTLASRANKRAACLEIVGHTSRSGPEAVNERISLLRAETVKTQIERAAPALRTRMIAHGVGARDNLVGTGRDDASDALDRRVVFKVIECAPPA